MSDLIKDNQNKKPRLGRGLGSLLGNQTSAFSSGLSAGLGMQNNTNTKAATLSESSTVTQPMVSAPVMQSIPIEARVWQIQVEKLVASKLQPRTTFEKEKLEELAASIKQHGILQPIAARKLSSGAFEIIAGERRWRAAQMAGLYEVPVIIKTLSNKETLELAIIENIQREDLSPLEEAEAYQRLMNEFSLTQQLVAEKVGKERATVANALRLLTLPEDTKELVKTGHLSAGHCKVLLGLEDKVMISQLAKKSVAQQLSVRKLEQELVRVKEQKREETTLQSATPLEMEKNRAVVNLQEQLQKILGTRVSIDYKKGKGKMSFNFYSDDELNELVEKIKRGSEN